MEQGRPRLLGEKPDPGVVFLTGAGAPLERTAIFRFMKVYAEQAGIRKTISPHTLRHSYATAMLRGGANLRALQMALGHSALSVTEIYTHLGVTDLQEAYKAHPLERGRRRTSS